MSTAQTENPVTENKTKLSKVKKKRSAKSQAIELCIRIAATVLLIWILLTFIIGIYIQHDNSSYPMIKNGDLCITFKLGKPARGDVIAYKSDGKIKFGRIAAVGGDTVEISDGSVKVDGYTSSEDTVYPTSEEGSKITYPYTVKKDHYFVLNDHRSDISDSRTLGAINEDDCKGKVIFLMRRRGF